MIIYRPLALAVDEGAALGVRHHMLQDGLRLVRQDLAAHLAGPRCFRHAGRWGPFSATSWRRGLREKQRRQELPAVASVLPGQSELRAKAKPLANREPDRNAHHG
jgi:hypothetical protein